MCPSPTKGGGGEGASGPADADLGTCPMRAAPCGRGFVWATGDPPPHPPHHLKHAGDRHGGGHDVLLLLW